MNYLSIFRRFHQNVLRAYLGSTTLALFLLIGCRSTAIVQDSTNTTDQFSARNVEPSESGENRDEEHGLDLKLHHDEDGFVRHDLFRESIKRFRKLRVESSIQWQQIGPAPATVNSYLAGNGQMPGPNSGAVMDIVIDPSGTTDQTAYAIPNDGGVWKTNDGGNTWLPKTDTLQTLSFGAIALDPSNSNIIYAGTGNIFNNGYFKGIGVYKSTDGGDTWKLTEGSSTLNNIGINKMVVPNSNVLLVATHRGMYRSTDQGTTYTQIPMGGINGLYITDLDLNPGTTSPIWASVYGKGIYVSTDQGQTFTNNLWGSDSTGAPEQGHYQFVSLGVSADGNTLYANASKTINQLLFRLGLTFERYLAVSPISAYLRQQFLNYGITVSIHTTVQGSSPLWHITDQFYHKNYTVRKEGNQLNIYGKSVSVWKSTNSGSTWSNITANAYNPENATKNGNTVPLWRWIINCQCGYDQTFGVDPQDPDRVYMGFQDLWLSEDGGNTWTDVTYDSTYTTEQMHVDHHALAFSPASHRTTGSPTRIWVGNDGGIWYSNDKGTTWTNRNATIASNLFRGIDTGRGAGNNLWTYGGMQDTGTGVGKPSLHGRHWREFLGGDGGKVAVDPTDPHYAYGMWGHIMRTTNGGVNIQRSWVTCDSSWSPGYYSDLAVDSQRRVYASGLCHNGRQSNYVLFRSTDYGANFTQFFKPTQSNCTVIPYWCPKITDIALSPADTSIIWLSISYGSVTKVTINQSGVPSGTSYTIPNAIQWQTASLAVDQTDANRVVAVFPGYSGQTLPSRHVFLTTDGGTTWNDISGRLPNQSVPDMPVYAAVFDKNTIPHSIIVSTDMGVLRTFDNGNSWHILGTGLPNVHTVGLAIDTKVNPSLLKVGTYGRSTWEITLSKPLPNDCTRPSIQARLENGETPYEIYNSCGKNDTILYGLNYAGGVIAYLDTTNGNGFVCSANDLDESWWINIGDVTKFQWDIPNAHGKEIGAGESNTKAIIDLYGLPSSYNPNPNYYSYTAYLAKVHSESSGRNWFLPSSGELEIIANRIIKNSPSGRSGNYYWSSTISNTFFPGAYVVNCGGGQAFANNPYVDNVWNCANSVRLASNFSTKRIPVITSFSPKSTAVGDTLVIQGLNFSSISSEDTIVFKNDVAALPIVATDTSLVVIIPTGAKTGSIQVKVKGEASLLSQKKLIIGTDFRH